jgi:hypothetical protein
LSAAVDLNTGWGTGDLAKILDGFVSPLFILYWYVIYIG